MMQANWSLILNVLLLVGVIIAIAHMMKARKQNLNFERYQPHLGKVENSPYDAQPLHDDIIAVRKVSRDEQNDSQPQLTAEPSRAEPKTNKPRLMPKIEKASHQEVKAGPSTPATVMILLRAKDNRQFAGYELLQTVLAVGLRFGEGNLFHRHQLANGQGPILCSLAAATNTGTFDLQNIGAFSVRGLCLFMQVTKNPDIDAESFAVMLDIARQLSEGLDAHLLDEQHKPLSSERISGYYRMLCIENEHDVEQV